MYANGVDSMIPPIRCWLYKLVVDTCVHIKPVSMDCLRPGRRFGVVFGVQRHDRQGETKLVDSCCVSQEIKWPDALERKLHADFLIKWGHPDFPRVAYVVDGTKVTMRNPSRVSVPRL